MSAPARQSGVALLVVLWMIALLSLLVAAASRSARIDSRSASFYSKEVQAAAIGESGLWAALGALTSTEGGRPRSYSLALAGGTAEVRVEPISARVNINAADASTLASLLDRAELTETQRKQLAERIVEWRTFVTPRTEDAVKNAPFYTVDELRQVAGMDEATYRRIVPFVTVFGGSAPDWRFVSEELAHVLGADAQPSPPAAQQSEPLPSVGLISISALGTIGGVSAHVAAVLNLTGRPEAPFEILAWHDSVRPGVLEN